MNSLQKQHKETAVIDHNDCNNGFGCLSFATRLLVLLASIIRDRHGIDEYQFGFFGTSLTNNIIPYQVAIILFGVGLEC